MRGLGEQLRMSLRLYYRNRMALFYGYLFPTVFLLAFWVLYRYDRVPLVRHVGEFLTVTILAGACFGLPTTLVGERERGVWRRYKLAPVPAGAIVVSTVLARYAIIVSAGLLQMVLGVALGMPLPDHLYGIWVAFTLSAFAFIGLGLVIAMLADNVPAVQALGQSIFLPMLILGGVAVPLTALPEWAVHVSAFFPGRYSVDAIQSTVNGPGLDGAGFSLLALVVIGLAACLAGGRMFRWDAQQRFVARGGKGWIVVALAAWVAVGVAAEYRGYVRLLEDQPATTPAAATTATPAPAGSAGAIGASSASGETPPPSQPSSSQAPVPQARASTAPTDTPRATSATGTVISTPVGPSVPAVPVAPVVPAVPAVSAVPVAPDLPSPTASWQSVRLEQIDQDLVFTRLPPDSGVVTPIAPDNQEVDADAMAELEAMRIALETWAPAKDPDLLQRVRNLLFVASVVDVFQWPTESLVPHLIFNQLQREIPRDDLLRILYTIAVKPEEGSDSAVDQMAPLGLRNGPANLEEVRGRAGAYAVKLIGRITGKRPGR